MPPPVGKFLKFGVVDVGPVHGDDVPVAIIRRSQHERVMGSGRGEPDV